MIKDTKLINILTNLYLDNPSGAQATALWKIIDMYQTVDYDIIMNEDKVEYLQVRSNNDLISYYSANKKLSKEDIIGYKFVVLNEVYYKGDLDGLDCSRYFKKVFSYDNKLSFIEDKRVSFKSVNIEEEVDEVKDFINFSYDDITVRAEQVKKWTKHQVYHKDLWVWCIDKSSGRKVALGIGEIDNRIGEGALEWIQVLPELRGKGYGKAIVNEMLKRMEDKVDFITVSGKLDDISQPDKLYEKCGFTNEEKWLIIRG